MIEVKGLVKKFKKKTVLNGIDLVIKKGEITTIIGQSGCGKSVFLKHLVGLFKPDSGDVYVDGINIMRLKKEELVTIRKKFSYLFQGGALFDSLNIAENVAFPIVWGTKRTAFDKDVFDKVRDVLAMVGLKDVEYLKPSELSGGMQKRAALARAIINEPEYILYDEPTTGLDPVMSSLIDKLILDLNKKLSITSIVVTHDMQSVYKISDKIAMLYDGKIIFEGDPNEIKMTKNEIVKQFINRNSDGPIVIGK